MVASRTYQKFSSYGPDLAELEPKKIDHRQFPTYPCIKINWPAHYSVASQQTSCSRGYKKLMGP